MMELRILGGRIKSKTTLDFRTIECNFWRDLLGKKPKRYPVEMDAVKLGDT